MSVLLFRCRFLKVALTDTTARSLNTTFSVFVTTHYLFLDCAGTDFKLHKIINDLIKTAGFTWVMENLENHENF